MVWAAVAAVAEAIIDNPSSNLYRIVLLRSGRFTAGLYCDGAPLYSAAGRCAGTYGLMFFSDASVALFPLFTFNDPRLACGDGGDRRLLEAGVAHLG
jgi:hypothetical protein